MKKQKILLIICILEALIIILKCCEPFQENPYEHNAELYGDHFGRDFGGYVGDGKYMMMYCAGGEDLYINNSPSDSDILLMGEYDHFYDNNNLYYYSVDGYAIIYAESNICKVFITDPEPEVIEKGSMRFGYRKKENNYRIEELAGDEFNLIVYLNSFDEYTEQEQKMLKKLSKFPIRIQGYNKYD